MVLRGLVMAKAVNVRCEACAVVANMCSGSPDNLRSVMASGLLPAIVASCKYAGTSRSVLALRTESAWVLANSLSQGTADQVHYIMMSGAGPALIALLPDTDGSLALAICCALRRAIRVCEAAGMDMASFLVDGIDEIDDLICRPHASRKLIAAASDLMALATDSA
eukprot:m.72211 g.72211  ORF g.72211 m.72211 type:complete len:166 (+) comp8769_c0_seq1:1102-1599(+)